MDKAHCVHSPTAMDLFHAATKGLDLQHVTLEAEKRHPKDTDHMGRIRIDLSESGLTSCVTTFVNCLH
jgi:hypothetical protein